MSLINQISSEKLSLKNLKIYKKCMDSLTFLPPSNFTVLDGCYFFWYCLQRAENYINCNCLLWVNWHANEQKIDNDFTEESPITQPSWNLNKWIKWNVKALIITITKFLNLIGYELSWFHHKGQHVSCLSNWTACAIAHSHSNGFFSLLAKKSWNFLCFNFKKPKIPQFLSYLWFMINW